MTAYKISRRVVLLGALPAACGLAPTQKSERTNSSSKPTRLASLSATQAVIDDTPTVATLDALRARDVDGLPDGAVVRVTAPDAAGRFAWDARAIVRDDGLFAIAPDGGVRRGRWIRDTDGGLNVRWFGASPSASAAANTAAFAAVSAAINRAGGGTLLVPPGTYRVGVQTAAGARGRQHAYKVADVIRIEGCADPVTIRGPGATLKAADGLRYGSFDPVSGRPHTPKTPFTDPDFSAGSGVLVYVAHCRGDVHIEGLTLDGNLQKYVLGGEWGDTGRQLAGDGILCEGNTGAVVIADVTSRSHGRDGIMLIHGGLTPRSPRYPVTLTNVTCDRNGRQGLSWVGGTQLTVTNSRFTRTGKERFASAPAAGLDCEAEGSVCRNGRFVGCKFVDNSGIGFVTDSGDVADLLLERCEFIGTTNWSAWPKKPGIVFRDCLFVGSLVNVHGDADPRRATQFYSCRFHADPALSPTRAIYGGYLADLGSGATNVLMRDCDFRCVTPAVALPWTPADIRFDDCRFAQVGRQVSYPRGVFTGVNTITSAGNVELYGSKFLGKLTLNGRAIT